MSFMFSVMRRLRPLRFSRSGAKKFVDFSDISVRYALERHIAHARLVGIVRPAVFKRGTRHSDAALTADGHGDSGDPSGFDKLRGAAESIVIDYTDPWQAPRRGRRTPPPSANRAKRNRSYGRDY